MKNVLYLLVVIFATISCGPTKEKKIGKLTIATFNTFFLWDGISPEEGNKEIYFPHKGNPVLAKEHIKKVADVIREINPDIVNLVEVEGLEVLNFLNDSFLVGLNYYVGFIQGIDTYTGQDVALLSRYPIENIIRYTEKGKSSDVEKSVSKNYVADINVGDNKLSFIGIHLLARPYDNSRVEQRQAQADAIKTIALRKKDEGRQVIILGDFNDYDGDSCCIDIQLNKPVTNVLNSLKKMDVDDEGDDLVNVSFLIGPENRYTAHWDKNENGVVEQSELSAIDHILIAPELTSTLVNAYIYQDFNPIEVSDHFPVVAEFEF